MVLPSGGGARVHTFNPNTQAEAGGSLSFKASLVYSVNSGTAKATLRKPVSKDQKTKERESRDKVLGAELQLSFLFPLLKLRGLKNFKALAF